MRKNRICLLLAVLLLLTCLPVAQAAGGEMTFSDGVVEYIELGEGFSPQPVNDGTGWYIGYGCLIDLADYPNGITEEEADALVRENMQKIADYINIMFLQRHNVTVTQGQFDAMIAMNYALGPGWMAMDNRLPNYIVNGVENYTDQQIASAFAAWCHVGVRPNTIALKRRIAEAKMFLYDDYSFADYNAESGWRWAILDANGGENQYSDVDVFKLGEPYGTLPVCTRSGWYFAGWAKPDGSILRPTDIVSENLDLKATWSQTPVAEPDPPAPAETPAEPAPPEEPDPPAEPAEPEDLGPCTLFPDVPDRAWYAEYVAKLVQAGVVHGYDDGRFRPDNDVTWGEALKLILLSSGFRAQDPLEAKDGAPPSHWASGYLDFAEKKGYLVKGSVSDLDAPITRDAMADLCAAALELTDAEPVSPYADSNRASALKLFAAGIMEGSFDESGRRVFKGGDRLRRSEICAVLTRVQEYVARTWILFAGYRVRINYDLLFNHYYAGAYSKDSQGRIRYNDGVTPVRYGIDVSWHQGDIDWTKVAADGIHFAIIRCGYRGGSAEGNIYEDSYFRQNISGALQNGIKVGVYFFSQATSVEEAMEELEFTLNTIRGWTVTMPVVFDWEQYGSRTQGIDWNTVTDCIVAFCDGVAAAGYTPVTYYNPSMAYLRLDLPRLQNYTTWLANYVDVPGYIYDYQMWQYGSSGTVDGINGRVDMDILFTNLWNY